MFMFWILWKKSYKTVALCGWGLGCYTYINNKQIVNFFF